MVLSATRVIYATDDLVNVMEGNGMGVAPSATGDKHQKIMTLFQMKS